MAWDQLPLFKTGELKPVREYLHVWNEAERARARAMSEKTYGIGLNGAKRMQFALFRHVCDVRVILGVKLTEDMLDAATHDRRAPFAPSASTADVTDTKQTALAPGSRLTSIFGVLLSGRGTKIANPVVVFDPVFVVNLNIGEVAIKDCPRNSMCEIALSHELNLHITMPIKASSSTSLSRSRSVAIPRDHACLLVIRKNRFKLGNKVVVHSAPPKKGPTPKAQGEVPGDRAEERQTIAACQRVLEASDEIEP